MACTWSFLTGSGTIQTCLGSNFELKFHEGGLCLSEVPGYPGIRERHTLEESCTTRSKLKLTLLQPVSYTHLRAHETEADL
eukprot:3374725-Rhodomonas_salina.2